MKTETRGRKALPTEQHKPAQKTVKVNEIILPLVMLLKSNLKKGLLSPELIKDLINVANNKTLPFKQLKTTSELKAENKLFKKNANFEKLFDDAMGKNRTLNNEIHKLKKENSILKRKLNGGSYH